RLVYVTFSAFGDPQSAPIGLSYLASRDAEGGWSSRPLDPPMSSTSFYEPLGYIYPKFQAFSPDLCHAWYRQDSDVLLAPGAVPGFPNLYEVDLCGGEDLYRALTTLPPTNPPDPEKIPKEGYEIASHWYRPTTQGFSADGGISAFWAGAALTPDAA